MKSSSAASVLCAFLLLFASCATTVPTYTMYPKDRSYADGEVAVLLVSYQLQVKSFDGLESTKKGKYGTIYRLLPGLHRIAAKVDFEVTPRPDEMVGMILHDHAPYTLPHEHRVGTTYTSDLMEIELRVEAGWLYSLQVAWSGEQARLAPSRGKSRMTFADGTEITLLPEKQQLTVTRAGKRRTYGTPGNGLFFSPDAQHLAVPSGRTGGLVAYWVLMRDGVDSDRFGALYGSGVAWSADSKHFAYTIYDALYFGPWPSCVVLDSVRKGPYDVVALSVPPFFTADGTLCYGVKKGKDWYFIRGDREQKMATSQDVAQALQAARSAVRGVR